MHEIEHELTSAHRPQLEQMLRATDSLAEAEVGVALELIDLTLANPDASDYSFLVARASEGLVGYVCYGPTPMTEATWDMYWLVTHPAQRRKGVARALVQAMEARLRSLGARLIRVETSSQDGYGAARKFYRSCGYEEAAALRDFYRIGDDLLIYVKSLAAPSPADEDSGDGEGFEAVYDLAFSYRDFDFERDFLRTCSRTHGRGEPTRVLEWACGPSRHLHSFAALNDVECIGVDLSPGMVELARRRVRAGRVRIERGNMLDHVVSPPVDLAFTMLSSIHGLGDQDALAAHLRTCAASLHPGGIYVIEATHPRDLGPGGTASTQWVQRRGDVSVTGRFDLELGARSGESIPSTLELSFTRGTRERGYRVRAAWTIPTFEQWKELIARVPELELAAAYGDFHPGTSATSVTAWRLILVLRRRTG